MKIECFGCNAAIEADDADGIVAQFLAHARESHEWSAPQEALRNYARNCGEATERVSGEVNRLPEIGELRVHPVTHDRIDDWLRFFDHEAFAGNPNWASCYCLEPHDPPKPELPERPWRETRGAMIERLRSGGTFGYLAYVEGRTAGWVNASLRSHYAPLLRRVNAEGPEPSSVIGVSCFLVAPPFRRHRIASSLLERVVADAAIRGASWIEGYPHNEPKGPECQHFFRGPRSLYEAHGFEPVEVRERDTVMRRPARSNGA